MVRAVVFSMRRRGSYFCVHRTGVHIALRVIRGDLLPGSGSLSIHELVNMLHRGLREEMQFIDTAIDMVESFGVSNSDSMSRCLDRGVALVLCWRTVSSWLCYWQRRVRAGRVSPPRHAACIEPCLGCTGALCCLELPISRTRTHCGEEQTPIAAHLHKLAKVADFDSTVLARNWSGYADKFSQDGNVSRLC